MSDQRGKETTARLPLARWLASETLTLVVVALGIAFVAGASQLTTVAGRFPMLLGGLAAVLATVEALARLRRLPAEEGASRSIWSAKDWGLLLWLCATVGLIYAFGILLGSFASTALYSRLVEGRNFLMTAGLSALNVFVIWLAFAFFAGFELYQGALFE